MAPHCSTLAWKSHGRRSLVGYSSWGPWESDTTGWLHFHFLFSCIGEGNGNPLQCSCLENPRDGGAWWAAVYEVAWSRTWLKRLSSSLGANHLKFVSNFPFWLQLLGRLAPMHRAQLHRHPGLYCSQSGGKRTCSVIAVTEFLVSLYKRLFPRLLRGSVSTQLKRKKIFLCQMLYFLI